jgi:quinol monooxygenase YgiN
VADLSVVAVLVAKPGHEDAVREALTALVAPTRDEEGCLHYELCESASTPGTFVTQERWRAQEDLDAHLGTPHVQEALATAGHALAAPPAIHPLVLVA